MFHLHSHREKLINARYIASVLFEVLKTVTNAAGPQVFPILSFFSLDLLLLFLVIFHDII